MEFSLLSWITARKSLLGFIVLMTFVVSANGLLFGSHAVEEARGAVTVSAETGHQHHHHDEDHGDSPDDTHCCDTRHSHDLTGINRFELGSWTLCSSLGGGDPTSHLLEVFPERFIPPQPQA